MANGFPHHNQFGDLGKRRKLTQLEITHVMTKKFSIFDTFVAHKNCLLPVI